ncbi:unnamed protein product [Malus baccata var. baccata]
MACRGRGRGHDGFSGGGGFGFAKQEPFDIDLPIPKDMDHGHSFDVAESICIVLVMFYNNILLEHVIAEKQNKDVERYFDRTKPKTTIRRISLFRLEKLDLFEQLEQRQGQNDTKEKKEGEGEDEDENEEEEDFSDDDYYKD